MTQKTDGLEMCGEKASSFLPKGVFCTFHNTTHTTITTTTTAYTVHKRLDVTLIRGVALKLWNRPGGRGCSTSIFFFAPPFPHVKFFVSPP